MIPDRMLKKSLEDRRRRRNAYSTTKNQQLAEHVE
jgi:hypothetical protein